MLAWTLAFLAVALVAALCGFSAVAASALGMARMLLALTLIGFAVSWITGGRGAGAPLL